MGLGEIGALSMIALMFLAMYGISAAAGFVIRWLWGARFPVLTAIAASALIFPTIGLSSSGQPHWSVMTLAMDLATLPMDMNALPYKAAAWAYGAVIIWALGRAQTPSAGRMPNAPYERQMALSWNRFLCMISKATWMASREKPIWWTAARYMPAPLRMEMSNICTNT